MEFKTKPFNHQLEVFNMIKDFDYFALFWEMGTGKTKEAIDVLRYKCYLEKRVQRVLVVCPKIATHNWQNEFMVHSAMVEHVEILEGTKKQRIEKLRNKTKSIFIINFEGVVTIYKELLQKWDMIIIDESQRIKNYKANQSKAVVQLGTLARFRLILSGTPILNSPIDVFNQYLFLDHGKTFGTNFFAFRNYFFNRTDIQMGPNRSFPKFSIRNELFNEMHRKIMGIADNRKKKECLDLPDKVYQTLELEMTKEQAKAYEDMRKDLITIYKEDPEQVMIAGTAATKIIRLRQISSGYMKLDETDQEVRLDKNPKMLAVKELLEDLTQEHKIIIWACFRNNIKLLQKELEKYNPAVIYGDTKDKYGEQDKFKEDGTCRVMIANPQSAGLAINLVEADYAIYFSQGFDLEHRAQSEDRCHRSGSERHDKITYIDFIFPKSIDGIILNALKSKKKMAGSLIKSVVEELI
jgi:SNF2 family DNA or RNA helicase